MKRNIVATTSAFCLSLCAALAHAQTQTVYEVRGPNGPVYSDKPMPGARAIELPPLNVVDFKAAPPATNPASAPVSIPAAVPATPGASTATTPRKPDSGKALAPAYRSLYIVSPEQNGSIIAPSASFEVRLALEPALLLGEGHAFAVSINGKALSQRFTASEFMIPDEFWGDKLPPPNQRYQLSARVIDRDGATLKEALPVVFTLRYAPIRPLPTNQSQRTPAKVAEPDPSPNQAKPKVLPGLLR